MKRKGFTLIELLVVIAIIGILATIGLVALNGAREKARDATRKSDIGQIRTAMVLYSDDNPNQYPGTDSVTYSASGTGACTSGGAAAGTGIWDATNDLSPTYISKVPCDPTNDSVYHYKYDWLDGSPDEWVLATHLEQSPNNWFFVVSDGTSGTQAGEPVCGGAGTDDVCD